MDGLVVLERAAGRPNETPATVIRLDVRVD